MSHAVEYMTVKRRRDIVPAAEDYAFYNTDRGENPDGHYHGNMTIHDGTVYACEEDAHDAINRYDTGWYSDHAVPYYRSGRVTSRKLTDIEKKLESEMQKRDDYIKAHSVKTLKAKLITCPQCGSKISREYLRGEHCPVCGKDLRAAYIIERIDKFDEKIKSLRKQRDNERVSLKRKAKGEKVWLMKVEVHC